MAAHIVFGHTVRGLVERVLVRRGLLTPAVVDGLLRHGVDVHLTRDLPIERWWALLEYCVSLLAEKPTEATWEQLGAEGLEGYADTLCGRPAFLLMRMLGPRFAMRRIAGNYRAADTVTRVAWREHSPTCVELEYSLAGGIPHPAYFKGVISAGMALVGVADAEVGAERLDEDRVRFTVRWAQEEPALA